MARIGSRIVMLAVMMLAMVCLVHGQQARRPCNTNVAMLNAQCGSYVKKGPPVGPPSLGCCYVVRSLDIPCICRSITPNIERLVDMKKVFVVAAFCGRPIRRGTRCGSTRAP